jgi:anti-sigma regulatory factor (Ser/Thr protein kinase)
MERKQALDASEFCLVLTPTWGAAARAGEWIRERFAALAAETRRDLAAVIAELVQNAVDHRPGRPIVVTVALGDDAIHGEVADRSNPTTTQPIANGLVLNGGRTLLDELTSRWDVHEGTTDVWFEIPLAR